MCTGTIVEGTCMSYRHRSSIRGFQNLERQCLHKP